MTTMSGSVPSASAIARWGVPRDAMPQIEEEFLHMPRQKELVVDNEHPQPALTDGHLYPPMLLGAQRISRESWPSNEQCATLVPFDIERNCGAGVGLGRSWRAIGDLAGR
jgi:hypothetical protein